MANGKDLLNGAQALKADIELIEALRDIAQAWEKQAAKAADLPSLEAIFDEVADDLDSDLAKAAFKKIEAEAVRVRLAALVKAASGLSGKLPAKYRLLLTRFSDFKAEGAAADRGLVAWTLLDKDQALPVGGDFNLSLKGAASLKLEAGDIWPDEADAMPAPLLRLTAEAGVGAKGTGKAPFQGGSLGVTAEAATQVNLSYFYNAPPTPAPYVVAVAQRLPNLPDPYDFDSVWNAFQKTDLAGLIYSLDGNLGFEVKVSLADSVTLAKDVNAALGATITVGVQLKGGQRLTLRRDPADATAIVATLSRSNFRQFNGGLSVGANIDLSALADRVHAILQQAMDVWEEELPTIQSFLSPGTWLQDQGSTLIGDAAEKMFGGASKPLQDAIVRDLRGAIGVDTQDETAIGAWLKGEISGALSGSGLLKKAEGGADRIVDRLAERLPAFSQTQFRAELKGAVEDLACEVENGFKSAADKVLAEGVDKAGATLKRLGEKADVVFASLDDALAGIRRLVDRYDALFKKVLAETQDAARRKVSGRIQFEELRTSEALDAVTGRLTSNGASARAAFRALTRGELNELFTLVDGPPIGGFEFLPEKSSFRRFRKSESKVSYEVLLLGFGISGADLLSGEADVVADGFGNIKVDARAVVVRNFTGLRENREVSLLETYGLRLMRGLEGAPSSVRRSLEVGLSITHHDSSLKRAEVESFVTSLEAVGLVPAGTAERGRQQFTKWTSDSRLVADISAKLWLNESAPLTLMRMSERKNGQLSAQARRDIVNAGIWGLVDAGVVNREDLEAAAKLIAPYLKDRPQPDTVADIFIDFPEKLASRLNWSPTRRLAIDWPSTSPNYRRNVKLSGVFEEQFCRLDDLLSLITTMGSVYEATPQDPGTHLPADGWSAGDYSEAQKKVARFGRSWLQLNAKLFWIDKEVAPVTVALLAALARLSGLTGQAPMTLIITRHPDEGPPETVALA